MGLSIKSLTQRRRARKEMLWYPLASFASLRDTPIMTLSMAGLILAAPSLTRRALMLC